VKKKKKKIKKEASYTDKGATNNLTVTRNPQKNSHSLGNYRVTAKLGRRSRDR